MKVKADEMEERILHLETELSELQSRESKLKEESEELFSQNTEMDDFASVVSHDLKEPLLKVISFSEMI